MLVKLPTQVSGKELIEALDGITKELRDTVEARVDRTLCYVPGSVKMETLKCKFSIFPKLLMTKGFFKKRVERVATRSHFYTSELHADNVYQEIDLRIGQVQSDGSFGVYWKEYAPESMDFKEIQPILEELIAMLYLKLGDGPSRG